MLYNNYSTTHLSHITQYNNTYTPSTPDTLYNMWTASRNKETDTYTDSILYNKIRVYTHQYGAGNDGNYSAKSAKISIHPRPQF